MKKIMAVLIITVSLFSIGCQQELKKEDIEFLKRCIESGDHPIVDPIKAQYYLRCTKRPQK